MVCRVTPTVIRLDETYAALWRRFSNNNHGVQNGPREVANSSKGSKRSFAKEVNIPRTLITYS